MSVIRPRLLADLVDEEVLEAFLAGTLTSVEQQHVAKRLSREHRLREHLANIVYVRAILPPLVQSSGRQPDECERARNLFCLSASNATPLPADEILIEHAAHCFPCAVTFNAITLFEERRDSIRRFGLNAGTCAAALAILVTGCFLWFKSPSASQPDLPQNLAPQGVALSIDLQSVIDGMRADPRYVSTVSSVDLLTRSKDAME